MKILDLKEELYREKVASKCESLDWIITALGIRTETLSLKQVQRMEEIADRRIERNAREIK